MKTGERRLLLWFVWIVVFAIGWGGVQLLRDHWQAQRSSILAATKSVERQSTMAVSVAEPRRFVPDATVFTSTDLLASGRSLLSGAGLEIREYRILSDSPQKSWVRFVLRGTGPQWARFLSAAATFRVPLQFGETALRLRERDEYEITLEIGYERHP